MSPTIRRFGAVSTLALATALGTPAAAQTPQDNSVFTMLGRIILGAGRARVAIDTPQAVTALETDDIEREQASTLGDLLRAVPGAEAFGGSAMTGQFLNIRGVGTSTSSDENRIIVTIDGVQKYYEQYRVGSHFGEPELYRRVEVLRGPGSSLLYGAGAIGGVVAFETRDASDFLTDESNTALRLRAGGNSNGEGYLGSAILAHRFNERVEMLAAVTTRSEGDADAGDGSLITGSNMQSRSVLVSGTIRLSDESEQRLRFSASRWTTSGEQVPYSAYGNFSIFGNIDRDVTDDSAQITWENPASDNPWVDARVQLSWTQSRVVQENATNYPGYPFAPPSGLWQDSEYAYEGLALDARNTFTMMGDTWENYLTIGGTVAQRDRVAVVGGTGYASQPGGTSDTWGLYLQNEFILNDRLTILGALRYDHTRLEATSGADASLLNQPVTHGGTAASLAMHYDINDAWSVFGSLADTTRLPTIDEVFDSADPTATNPLGLRPEHARTIELGFSWQGRDVFMAGDGLDLKLTAFNNQFRDMITRTGGGVPFTNIGRARIRGVELEASYQSERWFGRVAASMIDGVDQTTGRVLASTPSHQILLELGHRLPAQNLEFGWRGTFAGGMETASGDTVPGYGVHDLFVTWRPDQGALRGVEVQLAVNNVFDRYYYNALDVGGYGYAFSNPRSGRDVRLTLGRTFNF
ncbi:TonB-dependent receptor domain-containing protein [Pararhodobacter zhoushanensis]|uniref:TonB-dependent receptor domain-containing protein n=1 Tax=Pararhodobacter zhoushanensis TaxID=2479545 RepID=UPI000F8C445E|nr:TonB-dependent receptor [Pararhodobacter zhoushanensis]